MTDIALYPNIERRLGLHIYLRLTYVVDGYYAELLNDNDNVCWMGDVRPTIDEALRSLDIDCK